jgi:hypothetical protein
MDFPNFTFCLRNSAIMNNDQQCSMLQSLLKVNRLLAFSLAAFSFCMAGVSSAQVCGPAYTVVPQTVMEERIEQRLRAVWDVEYVQEEVTQFRPVLKERVETRRETVRRPVVETSTVEERYTVRTPVRRTEFVEQTYQETSFVTETSEREETHVSYRPVQETQFQTQTQLVQRPVTETHFQTQQRTTFQPVTTFQTSVVDQGQFVAQPMFQPGDTQFRLRWMGGGMTTNQFGQTAFRRGGLGWVPYTSPGTMQAQIQYQPNPVQVTIPQTTMMPQVENVQVPIQVTRMQTETVQTQVPVTVTRMEPVYETRKIPVTVQKPVTETRSRKVPVERVEFVDQVMVRPKTIERTSFKLETVERPVTVRYYENEAFQTTVTRPRRVLRYEPYEVRVRTPRIVRSPVVLSYSDPYSAANSWTSPSVASPSVASPSVTSPADIAPTLPSSDTTRERVTYGAAKPVVESEEGTSPSPSDQPNGGSNGQSGSGQPTDSSSDSSNYGAQKPEMVDLPQAEEPEEAGKEGIELIPSAPSPDSE